jgi:photosystem II stability/assembly factor-like uncharacterized protein
MKYILPLSVFLLVLTFNTQPGRAQIPEGWQWQNPLPHGMAIHDVVMFDEDYALAACENGYMMRSGDGGRTWSIKKITGGSIMDLSSPNDSEVWAISENGEILHSADKGATWTKQHIPPINNSSYASIHMYDEMRGMAISPRSDVFRTSNGGINWELIQDPYLGSDYGQWVTAQTDSKWYILGVTSEPRLYVSTDFGDSWTVDREYNTKGLNRLVFIDSDNIFQCRNGELLRSADGGVHWNEMDIYGFGFVTAVIAGEQYGDNLYCLSDGSVIINASKDNGATWNVSLLENAFEYASPNAMSFANVNVGLVVGNGGRILRTDDGGQSWNIVHGIGFIGHVIDVAFTDPDHGIALTSSTTAMLTSNGGQRWIETTPFADYNLQKISMYSQSSGFAYGAGDDDKYYIFHTSDIGKTWEQRGFISDGPTPERYIVPQAIQSDSESRVWVGFSYGNLYRSTDGGVSFDSLHLSASLRNQYYTSLGIFSFPDDKIILASSNGISQSDDGGDNWTFKSLQGSVWISDVIFTDPMHGFAITSRNFSATTNGGTTWESGIESNHDLIHFFDNDTGVVYLTQRNNNPYIGELRWTFDGGNSWSKHSTRERSGFDKWFWHSPEQGWAYGWGGMIRGTVDNGIVGFEAPTGIATNIILHQNYPNPVSLSAHGGTTLAFTVPNGAPRNVTITLYDALGRTIAAIADRDFPSGTNLVSIERSTLSSVTKNQPLFYVLRSTDYQQSGKMIVVE